MLVSMAWRRLPVAVLNFTYSRRLGHSWISSAEMEWGLRVSARRASEGSGVNSHGSPGMKVRWLLAESWTSNSAARSGDLRTIQEASCQTPSLATWSFLVATE